jgi:hypothetical protein
MIAGLAGFFAWNGRTVDFGDGADTPARTAARDKVLP